jgi:hypothetical protein
MPSVGLRVVSFSRLLFHFYTDISDKLGVKEQNIHLLKVL